MKSVIVVLAALVLFATDAAAVDLTETGFCYPTGTQGLGDYAGWLEVPPIYFTGYYHIGQDIDAIEGAAVYAISNGTVIGISNGGWGTDNKGVFVRHTLSDGSSFVALYGHVRTSKVVNDEVQSGVQFATIGPWDPTHLHFGIHPGGDMPEDPYGKLPLPVTSPYNHWVNPINWIETYSPNTVYSCSWHTQDPNTVVEMYPGETRTFTVSYTNTGNTTWQNTGGVSNPNYIELRSCDANGNVANSWLYPGSGWINAQRVVAANANNVQHDQHAWFIFTGKVPTTAQIGDYVQVYFRPYHATGGYIDSWGSMCFHIRIVSEAVCSDLASMYDYDGSGTTRIHAFLSSGSDFDYQGSGGWWASTNFTASGLVKTASGDFDGDGLTDVAGLYDYAGSESKIFVWLSTGSSFSYETWWHVTSGYDAAKTEHLVAGDFDEDGLCDLAAMYHYDDGRVRIHVWLSTGSSFDYRGSGGWWAVSSGYDPDLALYMVSGDFDEDGDDDIAAIYDYPGSEAALHVWLSTGSAFNYQGMGWWHVTSGYNVDNVVQMVSGDFNADGDDDIATVFDYGLQESGYYETRIHVFMSNHTSFVCQGLDGWWQYEGYTASKVISAVPGFFDGDDRVDICLGYRYSSDEIAWHMFLSEDGYFDYQGNNGWWRSTGYSPDKVVHVLSGHFNESSSRRYKVVGGQDDQTHTSLPGSFSLSQNYPNPFNPATTISFSLPEATHVELRVFNILGQRVGTLVDADLPAGSHSATWDANDYSSGIYFYRLQTKEATETKKMLLLK